jgi:peptidoglycan DL-endopeptidase CwlO
MGVPSLMKKLIAVIMLAFAFGGAVLAAPPAHAATGTLGDRVLNTAETKVGHWYSYGAAGPTYFDCSGLVYWASRQLGVSVPRSTYSMLAGSTHLYRISLSQVRRGDLVFYGTGHVEFATSWWHQSFGAHHTGTRVGWVKWSSYWHPTMALRFRLCRFR